MSTPIALRNLTHDRRRALSAVLGVGFAILLIFMQLGFRAGAERGATLVYDQLEFDVVLASPQYLFVARPRTFARPALSLALDHPAVQKANRLYVDYGRWRNPETRERHGLLLLAVDPEERPFRSREIDDALQALRHVDTVLIDTETRPEFGPQTPGTETELEGRRLTIVGRYTMGTGFVANGNVTMSDQTFARLRGRTLDRVSLGLLTLAPGSSPDDVALELNRALPGDVVAVPRSRFEAAEVGYFLNVKPVGIMFTTGVLVAFVVGTVILYQVLASDVQAHLREYATLKAIGYELRSIYAIVARQGILLAAAGFVPAWGVSLLLYYLLRVHARVPVEMTPGRLSGVLALAMLMSWSATLLALRKLRRADPADLF